MKFSPWCSSFYKQVLECWFNFFSKEPDSYLEILQENINNNRFIKIGNEQLDKNFDFLNSHSTIKIADIIEGSEFLPKYPCKRNTVMSIINFVILYAKRFILSLQEIPKNIINKIFYASLRHSIKAEIYICKINSQKLNLSESNSTHLNLWNTLLAECS